MNFFWNKILVPALITGGIGFLIILAIASGVNGVSIPTQFSNWFIG